MNDKLKALMPLFNDLCAVNDARLSWRAVDKNQIQLTHKKWGLFPSDCNIRQTKTGQISLFAPKLMVRPMTIYGMYSVGGYQEFIGGANKPLSALKDWLKAVAPDHHTQKQLVAAYNQHADIITQAMQIHRPSLPTNTKSAVIPAPQ